MKSLNLLKNNFFLKTFIKKLFSLEEEEKNHFDVWSVPKTKLLIKLAIDRQNESCKKRERGGGEYKFRVHHLITAKLIYGREKKKAFEFSDRRNKHGKLYLQNFPFFLFFFRSFYIHNIWTSRKQKKIDITEKLYTHTTTTGGSFHRQLSLFLGLNFPTEKQQEYFFGIAKEMNSRFTKRNFLKLKFSIFSPRKVKNSTWFFGEVSSWQISIRRFKNCFTLIWSDFYLFLSTSSSISTFFFRLSHRFLQDVCLINKKARKMVLSDVVLLLCFNIDLKSPPHSLPPGCRTRVKHKIAKK